MNEIMQGVGKSKLGRYLLTALLLSLAVTSGLYTYAYTTDTASITVTSGGADIATITDNVTVPEYKLLGHHRGSISAGRLFDITADDDYTGDLEVMVYLDNIDDLSGYYGMFLLRVGLYASDNTTKLSLSGIDKPLTLNNGAVQFMSVNTSNFTPGTTFHINTTGGVYRTFPWAYMSGSDYEPSLTAEIVQAGS